MTDYVPGVFPLRAKGPTFKQDEPSRHDVKAKRKADTAATWRVVCRQVDTRDGYKCRACGASGNPDGLDALDKLHRHHLAYRSKGGQDVASNLILLCARCHDALHVKRTLRIEPTTPHGADGCCEFWRTSEHGEFLSTREVALGIWEKD